MAREARQAAEKRRRRMHGARNVGDRRGRSSSLGIVLINVRHRQRQQEVVLDVTTTTGRRVHDGRRRRCRSRKVKLDRASCADPKKTYTATIETNFGTDRRRARRQERAEGRGPLHRARAQGLLRRADVASRREGLRDPGRRPDGDGSGNPGYPTSSARCRRTTTRWVRSRPRSRAAIPPGRCELAVLHRRPADSGATLAERLRAASAT